MKARRRSAALTVGLTALFTAPAALASSLNMAFHAPWDGDSAASLAAHGSALDVVVPAWMSIYGPDHVVTIADDPAGKAALASLPVRPRIWLMIQNAHLGTWDGVGAASLLKDETASATLLAAIDSAAKTAGASGVVVDFESLPADAQAPLAAFLRRARGHGHAVAVAVPVADPSWNLSVLAAAADRVILMAYDEHWQTGSPGPIASPSWFDAVVGRALAKMPPAKAIVAIASYAYDWPAAGPATVLSVDQARALAARLGVSPSNDPTGGVHFSYAADGVAHQVWFADANGVIAQMEVAKRAKVAGVALWRLGTEDAAVWATPFGRRRS